MIMDINMDRKRLTEILDGFKDISIAMFGDFYIDKMLYIDRNLDEPSLETNITAYQIVEKNISPGAAGTVLNSFCSLGAGKLYAVGVIGDDGEGHELRKCLRENSVDDTKMISCGSWSTPTYFKPTFRYEHSMQESNRLDLHNRIALPEPEQEQLLCHLYDVSEKVGAIVVSDQRRQPGDFGVITTRIIQALSDIAIQNPKLKVYVDSRAVIETFTNLTVKCNHLEALKAVFGDTNREADIVLLKYCAESLREKTGRDVLITWGENGTAVLSGEEFGLVPAVKVSGPIDVTGAGDSMTAGLMSAYNAGADLFEAALIGNMTASVTIRQIGRTGTATQEDIFKAFKFFEF
jgi:rfaE bifunctional protein kinase chain/domain